VRRPLARFHPARFGAAADAAWFEGCEPGDAFLMVGFGVQECGGA
jgi:hypothetical protein